MQFWEFRTGPALYTHKLLIVDWPVPIHVSLLYTYCTPHYTVYFTARYTALHFTLQCSVHCPALYTALHCTPHCTVYCTALITALPFTLHYTVNCTALCTALHCTLFFALQISHHTAWLIVFTWNYTKKEEQKGFKKKKNILRSRLPTSESTQTDPKRRRLGIPLKIHVAELLKLFYQHTIYH